MRVGRGPAATRSSGAARRGAHRRAGRPDGRRRARAARATTATSPRSAARASAGCAPAASRAGASSSSIATRGPCACRAGVRLDLGATAKALAADRAARRALRRERGGRRARQPRRRHRDRRATAAPAAGRCASPTSHRAGPGEPGQAVALASGGLATSSTARAALAPPRAATRTTSIDPRTGAPAAEHWRTVSVAAATCVDANIASTAAIVLGRGRAGVAAATPGSRRGWCARPARSRRPAAGRRGGGGMIAAAGPSALWYLTRGTGLVALLLLTASVVLGIVQVQRWAPAGSPRFVVVALHRAVSLLVVALLAVHVLTAVLDRFAPIRLARRRAAVRRRLPAALARPRRARLRPAARADGDEPAPAPARAARVARRALAGLRVLAGRAGARLGHRAPTRARPGCSRSRSACAAAVAGRRRRGGSPAAGRTARGVRAAAAARGRRARARRGLARRTGRSPTAGRAAPGHPPRCSATASAPSRRPSRARRGAVPPLAAVLGRAARARSTQGTSADGLAVVDLRMRLTGGVAGVLRVRIAGDRPPAAACIMRRSAVTLGPPRQPGEFQGRIDALHGSSLRGARRLRRRPACGCASTSTLGGRDGQRHGLRPPGRGATRMSAAPAAARRLPRRARSRSTSTSTATARRRARTAGAALIDAVAAAGLRGRGGAAFPTAVKLRAVAAAPRPPRGRRQRRRGRADEREGPRRCSSSRRTSCSTARCSRPRRSARARS